MWTQFTCELGEKRLKLSLSRNQFETMEIITSSERQLTDQGIDPIVL